MINYHKELVAALNTILPTHYELSLSADTKTPCISYQERDNVDTEVGNTIGYSRISYVVKVWGNDIAVLQEYAIEIDKALRKLGFKRISSNELYDTNSAMIQKILSYECLALEQFN